jgi:alkylation response protein AidB-like acyl-CoA dehydrogenase
MGGGISSEEALARARKLVPVLRGRSAATNRARRVPAETMRDFIDSGLLRLLQPVRHGGVEQDMETFALTAIELSRGCGSAGWIYSIFSNHQWMLGMFPDEAQRDVWSADPNALAAASFMPTGKVTREGSGYRLSGKWGFCSGCDNGQWIVLAGVLGMTGEPPHPDIRMFLVPIAECEIEDNWHVMGLRGTGSKNVIVKNAFVPGHRTLDFIEMREGHTPGSRVNPGPLYRVQAMANFALCLSAPAVGIAWGAYERFVEHVRGRQVRGKPMAQFNTIQMRLAESSAMIDSAQLLLLRDAQDSYETAKAGGLLEMSGRARNRRNHAYAATLACQATEKLLRAQGGEGLFEESEIQQSYRDVLGTCAHIGNNWDNNLTFFGRVTLGVPVSELIY